MIALCACVGCHPGASFAESLAGSIIFRPVSSDGPVGCMYADNKRVEVHPEGSWSGMPPLACACPVTVRGSPGDFLRAPIQPLLGFGLPSYELPLRFVAERRDSSRPEVRGLLFAAAPH